MLQNDSDSSDEENESFSTTNVLLGYASKEPTDDTFSQLGGHPTWLDDTSPPSRELAKCKICNSMTGMMTLLLQLNGDLPERFPGHERKLYIFSCRRNACRKKEGSVRAIRCVRISKAAAAATRKSNKASNDIKGEEETPKGEAKAAAPDLGDSIFNPSSSSIGATYRIPNTSSVIANPFAPQASNNVPSPFSTPAPKPPQPPLPSTDLPDTFAQKAQISPSSPSSAAAKQPWPPLSAFPSPYPSYHLDADYETLDPTTPPSVKTAMEIDAGGGGSKDDEKEAFESTIDKTFQRFADRLAQNPLQVLRYEFGGAPLLYSRSDDVGKLFSPPATTSVSAGSKIKTVAQNSGGGRIPRCQNCASQRVFELQLVPQAIAELEVEEEGLEGMEWGTVILGVCERDCAERGVPDGQVGWAEEWLGVQWEEDAKGGKR